MHGSVAGRCPICEIETTFCATSADYRETLACSGCVAAGGSIPRERGVAWVLELFRPDWRSARIHEFAPAGRSLSRWLERECPAYSASHWMPHLPPGAAIRGGTNENVHDLTWPDDSIDIVISLDVMEHIDSPESAVREVTRVLRPGGLHIFTTPTYPMLDTIRMARDLPDGEVEHLAEPEYHGSPNDPGGSLVYHRFGLDLASCVREWSGSDCTVMRFDAPGMGVAGYFTEVYVNGDLVRRAADAPVASGRWWRGRG